MAAENMQENGSNVEEFMPRVTFDMIMAVLLNQYPSELMTRTLLQRISSRIDR